MAGYRINERNIGSTTLDGMRKVRRKSSKITDEERDLARQVIDSVIDAMAYDKEMSEGKGHLEQDCKFTDGGRFTMMITRKQFELLTSLNSKL